jgi:hypothetical protein
LWSAESIRHIQALIADTEPVAESSPNLLMLPKSLHDVLAQKSQDISVHSRRQSAAFVAMAASFPVRRLTICRPPLPAWSSCVQTHPASRLRSPPRYRHTRKRPPRRKP